MSAIIIVGMGSIEPTKEEDKKGLAKAELRSLGIEPAPTNELNDKKELQSLADNVKDSMFQDYKTAYSKKGDQFKEEAKSTVDV
jgi:hypothetical protein